MSFNTFYSFNFNLNWSSIFWLVLETRSILDYNLAFLFIISVSRFFKDWISSKSSWILSMGFESFETSRRASLRGFKSSWDLLIGLESFLQNFNLWKSSLTAFRYLYSHFVTLSFASVYSYQAKWTTRPSNDSIYDFSFD